MSLLPRRRSISEEVTWRTRSISFMPLVRQFGPLSKSPSLQMQPLEQLQAREFSSQCRSHSDFFSVTRFLHSPTMTLVYLLLTLMQQLELGTSWYFEKREMQLLLFQWSSALLYLTSKLLLASKSISLMFSFCKALLGRAFLRSWPFSRTPSRLAIFSIISMVALGEFIRLSITLQIYEQHGILSRLCFWILLVWLTFSQKRWICRQLNPSKSFLNTRFSSSYSSSVSDSSLSQSVPSSITLLVLRSAISCMSRSMKLEYWSVREVTLSAISNLSSLTVLLNWERGRMLCRTPLGLVWGEWVRQMTASLGQSGSIPRQGSTGQQASSDISLWW